MPIETRTVLTCGHCGSPKAEANGWYLLFVSSKSITIRPSSDGEDHKQFEGNTELDCACGRECAIKMVSEALAGLKHTEHTVHDSGDVPRRWRKGKAT